MTRVFEPFPYAIGVDGGDDQTNCRDGDMFPMSDIFSDEMAFVLVWVAHRPLWHGDISSFVLSPELLPDEMDSLLAPPLFVCPTTYSKSV